MLRKFTLSELWVLFSLRFVVFGEGRSLSKETYREEFHAGSSMSRIAPLLANMKGRSVLSVDGLDADIVQCSEVLDHNYTLRCDFIKETEDCKGDDGFINYMQLVHCAFPHDENLFYVALVPLFLWLAYVFLALGFVAENFFCPSLEVISKTLKLNENIAGVTFLALGNGAPDVFSAIAAVKKGHGDSGGLQLAIGGLFGSGIFITTVVVFATVMVNPFSIDTQVEFLRDVIVYLGACFWTFYVVYDGGISFEEALGFIGLYVGYVILVIITPKILQCCSRRQPETETEAEDLASASEEAPPPEDASESDVLRPQQQDDQRPSYGSVEIQKSSESVNRNISDINDQGSEGDSDEDDEYGIVMQPGSYPRSNSPGQCKAFWLAVSPIDFVAWKTMKWYSRIYAILLAPTKLIVTLTTPLVKYNVENNSWNRILNSLHWFTAPIFCIFALNVAFKPVHDDFLAWQVTLCFSSVFCVLTFCTSRHWRAPVYHPAFAFFGFIVCVLWIYLIANELINILETVGLIFDISDEILGLLLLAIGNSIPDLITNRTNAKSGYPVMSMSACFGGPLLNMLLGFGFACIYRSLKDGRDVALKHKPLQTLLFSTISVSLVSSLFIMVCMRFRVTKPYGIYLLVIFLSYIVLAVLIETDVIKT
ncbi:mitochondrial sodium/calcium exchanger protein-like isoform X2 [Ptychodera flava]|uniref:mitochondrial sodium/calcium exchanger protein-like isoform X2 n=1 Tax=Ptychodera flava TaxID=63121 RepID=UPI00396A4D3E